MSVCLINAEFSTIVAPEFARWLRKEKKHGGRNVQVLTAICKWVFAFFKSRKESTQRRASSGETKTRVTLAFDITDSGIFKRGPWEKVEIFSHGLECGMVPFVVVIRSSGWQLVREQTIFYRHTRSTRAKEGLKGRLGVDEEARSRLRMSEV